MRGDRALEGARLVSDPARIPVIIAAGQVNDRTEDPDAAMDSLGLMREALLRADQDAGGGWLPLLDSLAVVDQSSFRQLGDLSVPLAASFAARPRFCYRTNTRSGVGPIRLLNEAADRIAGGEINIAAVVGGEALRTAALRAAAETSSNPSDHNTVRLLMSARADPRLLQYGLVTPTDVYPLYENASRAYWRQTLGEAQRETGEIWSLFSKVAEENEAAWLRKRLSPDEIVAPNARNRLITFPYTKFMVANSSVNQGAGFLVTSLAMARARGVADRNIIYVGHGAAASEAENILERDSYARSASMATALLDALSANHLTAADLVGVELYSCFPCVPKMARRIIDWPVDRPASVVGSLTFGGGPIGNYMSHAVAQMAEALRSHEGPALLFANGGLLTENHAIILDREPIRREGEHPPVDRQEHADRAREPIPAIDWDFTGRATIETFTVHYDRDGDPTFASIVGRTSDGRRFLAKLPGRDRDGIAFLTSGADEPIGSAGRAVRVNDETVWRVV